MKEHVVEVEECEVLQSAKAHEDEQARCHEPHEIAIAQGYEKGRGKQLSHASKLSLDGRCAIWHSKDRDEHGDHEDDDDRSNRSAAPEVLQQDAGSKRA